MDNICWESDYPHSDSMWPNAPEELHQVLTANSVPDDEINQMTHENAMRWYSFDPFAHVPREQATVGALRRRAAGHDVSVQPRSHQIVAPAQKLAAVRKKAEAAPAAAARG
ncbi:amidohydrolase family protein [Streptomyces sp. NPDC050149]|uniref:amidohydrolase family protein n=1 Tax=Streptomyces sp. NPDC050149 TaxID=3365603 RepID=UPI00379485EB